MKSYDHYWTSTLLWKKSLLISRNADNSNVNGQHRDSQLTREQYVLQCNAVNNLIKSLKSQHYSSIIKENSGNKKKFCSELFRSTFRKRPYASWRICCPFFTNKKDTLHNDLLVKKNALIDSAECVTDEILIMSSTKFSTFTEIKLNDIRELAATLL